MIRCFVSIRFGGCLHDRLRVPNVLLSCTSIRQDRQRIAVSGFFRQNPFSFVRRGFTLVQRYAGERQVQVGLHVSRVQFNGFLKKRVRARPLPLLLVSDTELPNGLLVERNQLKGAQVFNFSQLEALSGKMRIASRDVPVSTSFFTAASSNQAQNGKCER